MIVRRSRSRLCFRGSSMANRLRGKFLFEMSVILGQHFISSSGRETYGIQ